MKAFWWFKDNSIAGMARPGFNATRWLDLSFDENLIFGWIGQRSCGTEDLHAVAQHCQNYGSKILSFCKVDEVSFRQVCKDLKDPGKLREVFQKVADRTKCIDQFDIGYNHVTFRLNSSHLNSEIEFLKNQNIASIVSLTEKPNQHEILTEHFNLHHLPIDDLTAPKFEQALQLSEIIKANKLQSQSTAVHCMAGIGRTSTMIVAAHLLLGEPLDSLLAELKIRNPFFLLTGSQGDFIRSVASGRIS